MLTAGAAPDLMTRPALAGLTIRYGTPAIVR